jgi:hypothetical protein
LLNEETSRYLFRALAAKELITNPEKYGFDIPVAHLYSQEKIRTVEVTSSIDDLVKFAQDNGINYKVLKKHNPWLRRKSLTVRKGTRYLISIPVHTTTDLQTRL